MHWRWLRCLLACDVTGGGEHVQVFDARQRRRQRQQCPATTSTESQLQRVIRADVRQAHMLPGSKREQPIQANLTHRKVLLFFAVWPHAFSGAADASVARQRRGEPGLRSSSVLGPSSTPVPGVCRGALPLITTARRVCCWRTAPWRHRGQHRRPHAANTQPMATPDGSDEQQRRESIHPHSRRTRPQPEPAHRSA